MAGDLTITFEASGVEDPKVFFEALAKAIDALWGDPGGWPLETSAELLMTRWNGTTVEGMGNAVDPNVLPTRNRTAAGWNVGGG